MKKDIRRRLARLEAKLRKSAAPMRVPRITAGMSAREAERLYMLTLKGAELEDDEHPPNVPLEPTRRSVRAGGRNSSAY
jgi:hypothetical protein